MSVRIDKWLQVARVFKTRTQATKACALGRVRTNGVISKPHRPLALGDRIEIRFRDWRRLLVVKELREKPLPKAEAARVYDDESPPRPTPRSQAESPSSARRDEGAGRPSKRERRQLDRLRRR